MRITLNGTLKSTSAVSVAALVQDLGLEGKRIAVEKNGEIVPRSRYDDTSIADGDRIEIVGAVGGG
jgi:thiamine biosynthesis protein ThiS